MNEEMIDKKIKEKILNHTNEVSHLKEEVWKNISDELFPYPINKKRKRFFRGFAFTITLVVVSTLLLISFLTIQDINKGQAMFQSIKEIFIQEKKDEIELEGHKEDTNVHLETNEELRYIIYIDEDRYKIVEGKASDRIVTIDPLPANFPQVYMEIFRIDNTTTNKVITNIKEEISTDPEMVLQREEVVSEPINAKVIQSIGLEYTDDNGVTGHHWDTPIHRYYITEEDNDQVFVIKQVYFLEAAEGHGARFHYMLESFKVIK